MKKLFSLLVPATLAILLLVNPTRGGAAEAGRGKWLTDLDAALKQAKAEKKLVLLDFTGSDWCPACKTLHKDVFEKKEFVAYAKDKLVLVEVDFPEGKKQSKELEQANKSLSNQFKIDAFPTVVIIDAEAKEIHREVGYGGKGVKAFLADLDKLAKK